MGRLPLPEMSPPLKCQWSLALKVVAHKGNTIFKTQHGMHTEHSINSFIIIIYLTHSTLIFDFIYNINNSDFCPTYLVSMLCTRYFFKSSFLWCLLIQFAAAKSLFMLELDVERRDFIIKWFACMCSCLLEVQLCTILWIWQLELFCPVLHIKQPWQTSLREGPVESRASHWPCLLTPPFRNIPFFTPNTHR